MSTPYCCPNCKTNRSRFNIIRQVPQSVKLDPHTGEIVEEFTNDNLSPFHMAYKGPEIKVQCGSCGLVEDERTFIKFGER
ncbi:DNA alkylation repair protein [Bacillus sp. JJ1532]|uniref:DNA alkylation repair protein n=1 Tax=Bacillus sp. JJ1532 TaxID=3122958 RepID=UPI002FFEB1EF